MSRFLHSFFPRSCGSLLKWSSDCPFKFDDRNVVLAQNVRVRTLRIRKPALLIDDIEEPQFPGIEGGLNDPDVIGGSVQNALIEHRKCSLGRLVSAVRRANFLRDDLLDKLPT